MTQIPDPRHQGAFQKCKTGAGLQQYAATLRANAHNRRAVAPAKGTSIRLPCSFYTDVLMISESLY